MKKLDKELQKEKRNNIIFLIVLVVFATFLRVYNLNEVTGSDDSQSAAFMAIAVHSPKDIFYNEYPDWLSFLGGIKYTRPMVMAPLLATTAILGNTPLALLIPSLTSTIISIILLFYICKQLFGKNIAYYATTIFALSPFHLLFSRNALLHSQLTALWLLSALLFGIALKKQKPVYIYISVFVALMNQFTTDLRGLVPLVGLVPFYLLSKPTKKMTKHIIIALASGALFYLTYLSIPYLMWNDSSYLTWFINAILQGAGGNSAYTQPQPFMEVLRANLGMPFLTPFLGVITVPFLFGVFMISKEWRKPENSFMILSLLSISAFIISRQIFFERLVIYTPIFAVCAALAIVKAMDAFESKRNDNHLLYLTALTAIYITAIPIMMIHVFKKEFGPVLSMLESTGLSVVVNPFFIITISFLVLGLTSLIMRAYKTKTRHNIKKVISALFIMAIVLVPTVLVMGKVGEYDRARGAYAIAKYLNSHADNDTVCTSYLFDRSIIYYTGRFCMNWGMSDENNLITAIKSKKLQYTIIDTVYTTEAEYRAVHPEIYDWIINNSRDVTGEVQEVIQRDRFKLLKITPNPPSQP